MAIFPRAADQMAEDAGQLVELRNEQLADELLTPLLQACEQANQSHRSIESELLKAGFGSGSIGSVRSLFEHFASGRNSTASCRFPTRPGVWSETWRSRSTTTLLRLEPPTSLIQGLLDYATRNRADCGNARTALKRGPADRPQEPGRERPDQESSGSEVERSRATRGHGCRRSKPTRKTSRLAVPPRGYPPSARLCARVRWFWGIVIGGGVIWVVVAQQELGPQTTHGLRPLVFDSRRHGPTSDDQFQRRRGRDSFDTSEALPPSAPDFFVSIEHTLLLLPTRPARGGSIFDISGRRRDSASARQSTTTTRAAATIAIGQATRTPSTRSCSGKRYPARCRGSRARRFMAVESIGPRGNQ